METLQCAECGASLAEGDDRQTTDDGSFCPPCFGKLTAELQRAIAQSEAGINYPMAAVGGLLGALAGAVLWWGFTVVTKLNLGLIAVAIGFACGRGVSMLSGHKRHLNLQIISAAITIAGYFYAGYLVARTFINRHSAEQGVDFVLPLLPPPELFLAVVTSQFGMMDLVFLAIAAYQAWKIPAPIRIAGGS